MVVFACSVCGDSLKLSQVEKHCQTTCRNCQMLSCIDCGKEFWGQDYAQHNKCISEEEKYSGKNFKPRPGAKKGEQKHELWTQQVQQAAIKCKANKKLTDLLTKISNYPNIPRKKAKFLNFLKNSLRLFDTNLLDQAWDAIQKESADNNNKDSDNGNNNNNNNNNNMGNNNNNNMDNNNNNVNVGAEDGLKDKDKKKKKRRRETENNNNNNNNDNDNGADGDDEKNNDNKNNDNKNNDNINKVSNPNDSSTLEPEVKKRKKHDKNKQQSDSKAVENVEKANNNNNINNNNNNNSNNNDNNNNSVINIDNISMIEPVFNSSFKWKKVITKVLREAPGGELHIKKLRKKVLKEYTALNTGQDVYKGHFFKKLDEKLAGSSRLKLDKDMVSLLNKI